MRAVGSPPASGDQRKSCRRRRCRDPRELRAAHPGARPGACLEPHWDPSRARGQKGAKEAERATVPTQEACPQQCGGRRPQDTGPHVQGSPESRQHNAGSQPPHEPLGTPRHRFPARTGTQRSPKLPSPSQKAQPPACPPRAPVGPSTPLAAYLSVVLLRLPLRLAVRAKLSRNPIRSCQSPDFRQAPDPRSDSPVRTGRCTHVATPSRTSPGSSQSHPGPKEVLKGHSERYVRQEHVH